MSQLLDFGFVRRCFHSSWNHWFFHLPWPTGTQEEDGTWKVQVIWSLLKFWQLLLPWDWDMGVSKRTSHESSGYDRRRWLGMNLWDSLRHTLIMECSLSHNLLVTLFCYLNGTGSSPSQMSSFIIFPRFCAANLCWYDIYLKCLGFYISGVNCCFAIFWEELKGSRCVPF